MKAIIHIGTEKTGTTTLQGFIKKNRNKLLESGYYIPLSIGDGNNRGLASCAMEESRLDDFYHAQGINTKVARAEHDKHLLADLKAEMVSLGKKYHTVIFTSEHFHSRCVSQDEVNNVKGILTPYFEEFEIIVYLRPQVDMAVSLYSTYLRSGSYSKFDDFLEKHCSSDNPYYDYGNLLKKWSRTFGEQNIRVRIFDRNSMINKDVVDDFFAAVGFENCLSNFERVKNLNESLTPFGQEVLRLCNFYNYSFLVDDISFKNKLSQLINKNFVGKGYSPSASLAKKIQGGFEALNSEVAKKWFNKEKLFDFDFEAYGEGRCLEEEYKEVLEFLFSSYQVKS
ncbi:MAG: hypothetical protein ACQEUK_03245 [Pseudomonadota bacterium]